MKLLSRKDFLQKLGLLGFSVFGASHMLSSCGNEGSAPQSRTDSKKQAQKTEPRKMEPEKPEAEKTAQVEEQMQQKKEMAAEQTSKPEKLATETTSNPCMDVSELTPQELQVRKGLQYVDITPYPQKRCDNCTLWIEAEKGSKCGGCTVVKGPINPAGYCVQWILQQG